MSESNKFTPGPWSLDESRHAGCINSLNPFRHIGMVSAYQATKEDKEENRANALLISAAPDMLEALENLLWHAEVLEEFIESERGRGRNADQLYADGEMHNYMVEAKASISKARGKQ